MSTHSPESSRPESPELPELDPARIDAIEQSVFSEIRTHARRTRARRGRWIGVGAAAAAVVVVAAVIAPAMPGLMGLTPVGTSSAVSPQTSPTIDFVAPAVGGSADSAVDGAVRRPESIDTATGAAGGGMTDAEGSKTGVFGPGRDVAVTGSASLTVDNIAGAAALVAAAAEARGGTVQSMSVGTNQPQVYSTDGKLIARSPAQSSGWITVQVPAAELSAMIADLDGIGTVTALSTDRQDVTSYALDLQARTDAARASVERLNELVAGASTVSELIEADVALSERQATLESYEQQLAQIKDQVTMSTLSVNLALATEPASANPAGFGDGVTTGWNAVVATLNALVVALGFLVPWIAVVAVIGAVAWAIVALVRRGRRSGKARRATETALLETAPSEASTKDASRADN